MTLNEIKIGERAVVKGIAGRGLLRRRLIDMGITNGCVLYVRKYAPLGDPIEITVRGYELSIRKSEAQMIEVEKA